MRATITAKETKMKPILRHFLLTFVILLLTSSAALADIRIQLVQGKRTVKDQVSFTIEVSHETKENPRYEKLPEFIEIITTFASPASGMLLIDGRGVGRFDESVNFKSDRTEITYGRHIVTLQITGPAVVTSLAVMVRGGVPREVIGGEPTPTVSTAPAAAASVEQRIADLEQRVKQLEAEVATLKRTRRVP
jgi:cell division protein FtsL